MKKENKKKILLVSNNIIMGIMILPMIISAYMNHVRFNFHHSYEKFVIFPILTLILLKLFKLIENKIEERLKYLKIILTISGVGALFLSITYNENNNYFFNYNKYIFIPILSIVLIIAGYKSINKSKDIFIKLIGSMLILTGIIAGCTLREYIVYSENIYGIFSNYKTMIFLMKVLIITLIMSLIYFINFDIKFKDSEENKVYYNFNKIIMILIMLIFTAIGCFEGFKKYKDYKEDKERHILYEKSEQEEKIRINKENNYLPMFLEKFKNSEQAKYFVIPPKFIVAEPFSEGMAVVSTKDKYGYIDKIGNYIIPEIYEIAGDFKEGVAPVRKNGKYGYIDKTGKTVIDFKFDGAEPFLEGMAVIIMNGKYGYINKTGKIIIEPQYKTGNDFKEGLASVRKENYKYGYIDKTGKIVIDFIYDSAFDFKEGLAKVREGFSDSFIDKTGKTVIWGFGDKTKTYFSNGLLAVEHRSKYGFVDRMDKIKIEATYEEATDFNEGFALVKINSRYRIINKDNKFIGDKEFNYAWGFKEGYSAFMDEKNKFGGIDKKGNIVMPAILDGGFWFNEGMAPVEYKIESEENARYKYMNRKGYIGVKKLNIK